jgi:alcohol dehydrogenase (cytochrome c)
MSHFARVRISRRAVHAGACIVAGVSAVVASARATDPPLTDWPSFNRTLTSQRYAPLDDINRRNVDRLKPLCVYDLDVATGFETGPIVIGRTMYVTTDKEIMAIDAETCRQNWRVREEGPSLGLPINRGAAFLDGRLFRGAGEGHVMAYDASTGRKLWSTEMLVLPSGR